MKIVEFNGDDRTAHPVLRGVTVRPSAFDRVGYDLIVVAADVGDVVRSAGAWICDRVRAGWHVAVVVAEDDDVRPLEILGVQIVCADDPIEVLTTSSLPAALAIPLHLMMADPEIATFVECALARDIAEITVWGDTPTAFISRHFDLFSHPASAAAKAFKNQAMKAANYFDADQEFSEQFYSIALWYPPEGNDLVPVS